jgi:hypothetical protein
VDESLEVVVNSLNCQNVKRQLSTPRQVASRDRQTGQAGVFCGEQGYTERPGQQSRDQDKGEEGEVNKDGRRAKGNERLAAMSKLVDEDGDVDFTDGGLLKGRSLAVGIWRLA